VALSLVEGVATIGSTEFSLATNSTTLTPQTDDVYLSVRVSVPAAVAGDVFVVRVYEKINAGSSTPLDTWTIGGTELVALQLPLLMVGGGWDVTVQKTAGTDRSVRWTLEKETSSFTFTDDSATIGSTEYSLPGDTATPTPQSTDCYVQPWISFASAAAGDRFRVRVYEKMNNGSSTAIVDRVVNGAQSTLWTCPLLLVGGGWDVTVTKVAGTDRAIAWSLRTDPRTGVASEPEYPQLAHATTEEAIRHRIIAIIAALDPALLGEDRFRVYRNDGKGDFTAAMEAAPAGALRRFQVDDVTTGAPPEVSNVSFMELLVTFQVTVAYPHTGRYGAEQAFDRADVMKSDKHQIEFAIGLHGRGNFTSPNPDTCWRDGSDTVVEGSACDYLVLTLTYAFYRQVL
jgi:hypothetical protein